MNIFGKNCKHGRPVEKVEGEVVNTKTTTAQPTPTPVERPINVTVNMKFDVHDNVIIMDRKMAKKAIDEVLAKNPELMNNITAKAIEGKPKAEEKAEGKPKAEAKTTENPEGEEKPKPKGKIPAEIGA